MAFAPTHDVDDTYAVLERPAPDATPVGATAKEQTCRLEVLCGRWARVSFDDSTIGWVPAGAIAPIMGNERDVNLTSVIPALGYYDLDDDPLTERVCGVEVDGAGQIAETDDEPILSRWRSSECELICSIARSGLGPFSLLRDDYEAEKTVAIGEGSFVLTPSRLLGCFDSGESMFGPLAPGVGGKVLAFAFSYDDIERVTLAQAKRFRQVEDAAAAVQGSVGSALVCGDVRLASASGESTTSDLAGWAKQVTGAVITDRLQLSTDEAERRALQNLANGERVASKVPGGRQWEAIFPDHNRE